MQVIGFFLFLGGRVARRTDGANHFLAIRFSREWRTGYALSISIILFVSARATLPIRIALSS